MKNPFAIKKDVDGNDRFVGNLIVTDLLDFGRMSLDEIWKRTRRGQYDKEDLEMLYMLMGYSVSGFKELFPDFDEENY